jgi:hypothetical protein
MLIITGLGRCGTSLTMKILQDLDFNLGVNVSWIDEVNAGLELGSVHRINQEMYLTYLKNNSEINLDDKSTFNHWEGKTFRYIIQNFDRDTRQGDFVDVIKDPRLTWHPGLIRAWWEVRKDIKLLILHRDPNQIIKSRFRLDSRFYDPKDGRMKDVNMFKIDFSDFLVEVLKLEIPFKLAFYPTFCYSPNILFNALCGLCNNFNSLKEEFYLSWNKIYDETKVHQEI